MSRNDRDNALFDAILTKAFADAARKEFEEAEREPIEKVTLTPEHIKEERKAYEARKNSALKRSALIKHLKRAVACLLLAGIIGMGITLAIPSTRADFLTLITETFEKYFSFSGDKGTEYNAADYRFSYIPEGHELTYYSEAITKIYRFENVTENTYFEISYTLQEEGKSNVNNENTQTTEIDINSNRGYILSSTEYDFISLVWNDEANTFLIKGNISEELIIKIARNIKISE